MSEADALDDLGDLGPEWPIDWHDYIHCDPDILGGKPVIKGTRLSVEFLVSLVAMGWSEEQMLENYPTLTHEGLRAALEYAADLVHECAPRATRD